MLKRARYLFFSLALLYGAPADALESCRQAWQRQKIISTSQHKYNYHKERQATARGNEGYDWYNRTQRGECEKDWTFLIYQFAENDLGPYALADLYEIEAGFKRDHYAASTLKTDVIVEFDGPGEEGIRRLHMFETPEVYDKSKTVSDFRQMEPKQIQSPIVEWINEQSIGNHEQRLRAFLDWGIKKYPAKHYAVILWGHGQGWTAIAPKVKSSSNFEEWQVFPELTDFNGNPGAEWQSGRPKGGLAFSEDENDYLDVPALQRALKEAQETRLGGRPFDLYISDACLMQQIEVATEISDQARFIIGSPQVQNYLGLPYRRFFNRFNRGSHLGFKKKIYGKNYRGDVDEAMLAAYMLPELFIKSFNRGGTQWRLDQKGRESLSLSALSGPALKYDLRPELESFARALSNYLKIDPLRAFEVQFIFENTVSFGPGMKDMGTFLDLIGQLLKKETLMPGYRENPSSLELARRLDNLWRVVRMSVINKGLGEKYKKLQAYPSFSGLGIWLPVSEKDYRARVWDLSQSKLFKHPDDPTKVSAWGQFLDQVFTPLVP